MWQQHTPLNQPTLYSSHCLSPPSSWLQSCRRQQLHVLTIGRSRGKNRRWFTRVYKILPPQKKRKMNCKLSANNCAALSSPLGNGVIVCDAAATWPVEKRLRRRRRRSWVSSTNLISTLLKTIDWRRPLVLLFNIDDGIVSISTELPYSRPSIQLGTWWGDVIRKAGYFGSAERLRCILTN